MSVFDFSIGADEEEEEAEIEFADEILEKHNYIVLYTDNEIDWLQVQSYFDIPTAKPLHSKKGFVSAGAGRVINATKFFDRLINGGGEQ